MTAMTWDGFGTADVHVQRPARPLPRPAEAGPTWRLTRRGRRVVTAAALLLAVVGGLSAQRAEADVPQAGTPVVTHTVVGGETLWDIAVQVAAPGEDVRDVVDRLARLNGLPDTGLLAGQQILVPVP